MKQKSDLTQFRTEIVIVFIFLGSIGFPGTYRQIFGGFIETLYEYLSFLMQIVIMLTSSGETVMDVKLLDMKPKYRAIYQFMIFTFAESMLVTDVPKAQVVTSLRLSVTILFAIWLVEHFTLNRILKLFSYAQVLLDLAIVGIIVLRPGIAFQSGDTYSHALRGVYEAKNALASELAFGLIVMFLHIVSEAEEEKNLSPFWLAAIAFQGILLLMAKATGALLISMLIPMYFLIFRKLRDLRLPLGWLYVAGSVGFLVFAFTILPLFAPLLESMGKDATLTGRTELWNGIYKFMQQHNMLTGYGYGQFWMNKSNVKKLHLMYNHKSYFSRMSTGAHNQIMELWLNIGLFGIASYFLAIVGSMRYAKNMKLNEYMQVSSLFFYLMLCGLTERIFENAYAYRVVMFFILLAVACNHIPDRKQLRRRKNDEREASHHGGRADL